jgi:NAD(P)-dependent dehydrogenase (short-subunit alcohol dehydrogenase family)
MKRSQTLLTVAAGIAAISAVSRALRHRHAIDFSGRVAVITGGSRGLGLVLARQLTAEGCRVALLARHPEELDQARAELAASGAEPLAIVCDVGERADVVSAIEAVLQHYGRIDILINNAGIIQVGPLEHMTHADFERAMRVHFWGSLHCMHAVLPHFRERRAGRIVNIASIGGEVAVPHLAPYVASKFALVGLSNAVRSEVASEGIRVTTVSPGLMRTGSAVSSPLMKGNHEAEFGWFATLSSMPFFTIQADRAARKILAACRYGDPYLAITPQARLATIAEAIAPNLFARALEIGGRLLPAPAGPGGDREKLARESRPEGLPAAATRLSDEAAARNNELLATS